MISLRGCGDTAIIVWGKGHTLMTLTPTNPHPLWTYLVKGLSEPR